MEREKAGSINPLPFYLGLIWFTFPALSQNRGIWQEENKEEKARRIHGSILPFWEQSLNCSRASVDAALNEAGECKYRVSDSCKSHACYFKNFNP